MLIQLALDFVRLDEAMTVAKQVAPFVDIIEAGTCLIKSEGMRAVSELKRAFPNKRIMADVKIVDGARREASLVFGAGADLVSVLCCAEDATLATVVQAARESGRKVIADLTGTSDRVAGSLRAAKFGVDYVCYHRPTDSKTKEWDWNELSAISSQAQTGLMLAGGIVLSDIEKLAGLAHIAGTECRTDGPYHNSVVDLIVVVGGAITQSSDPASEAARFREAADSAIYRGRGDAISTH